MDVLVTGASGLLGEEIAVTFSKKHRVIPLKGRGDIDITKPDEIVPFIKEQKPDFIIHCAGWRDVDGCEKNRDKALLINTFGTRNIALAAKTINCPVLHISTDSVFDGEKNEAYTEFDKTNPVNVYGFSKLKAEEMIITLLERFFIVRVPILFGLKGKRSDNLIYGIWEKLKDGKEIYAPSDQICSPTYTRDVAEILLQMIETEYYGIYHISNEGLGSRYDLIKEIAEIKGFDSGVIIPCKSDIKYAKRPKYTAFNGIAFKNTFGVTMDDWRTALKRCINEIERKGPV